jgi:sulfur carrier protein
VFSDLPEDRFEISRDEKANHRLECVFVGFYFAGAEERHGGGEVAGRAQFPDLGEIAGEHDPKRSAGALAAVDARVVRSFYRSAPEFQVIQLSVNGQATSLEPGANIARLLETLELSGKRVAVEKNGEIVPRSQYLSTRLAEGDALEIVVAVGGGQR